MEEAWLSGKLEGFAPVVMPAAHALAECAKDLQKHAADLNYLELNTRPNNAPSVAFHLKHIAGSIDRLLTYARGEQLNDSQFAELKVEKDETNESSPQLIEKAVARINEALETLKITPLASLFEPRYVGRKKLETNVFGLLFHIAEHTARHTGQIVTTTKIVRQN
jgi:uncharacterized damage-inducible protein DinB